MQENAPTPESDNLADVRFECFFSLAMTTDFNFLGFSGGAVALDAKEDLFAGDFVGAAAKAVGANCIVDSRVGASAAKWAPNE